MLKPSIPSKFVERIITSQTGEQYRVVFQVTLINGEVKARVVSAELITEIAAAGTGQSATAEALFLPGFSAPAVADTAYVSDFAPVVSPFTSLLFFTSQPTRAPSSK
jgi:hypothetical protein